MPRAGPCVGPATDRPAVERHRSAFRYAPPVLPGAPAVLPRAGLCHVSWPTARVLFDPTLVAEGTQVPAGVVVTSRKVLSGGAVAIRERLAELRQSGRWQEALLVMIAGANVAETAQREEALVSRVEEVAETHSCDRAEAACLVILDLTIADRPGTSIAGIARTITSGYRKIGHEIGRDARFRSTVRFVHRLLGRVPRVKSTRTWEELAQHCMDTIRKLHVLLAAIIMLLTGSRYADVCRLHVTDVFVESDGAITVERMTDKVAPTGTCRKFFALLEPRLTALMRPHVLPRARAAALLRARPREQQPLFVAQAPRSWPAKALGVPCREIRRAVIEKLLSQSFSRADVCAFIGHSLRAHLSSYALGPDRQDRAMGAAFELPRLP